MEEKNGRKLEETLLEIWESNAALIEWMKSQQANPGFKIWVSYLVYQGHERNEIMEYAKEKGLGYDALDNDPEEEEPGLGAIVLSESWYKEAKGSKRKAKGK